MTTYFYTLVSTRDENNVRYVGKTVKPLQYRLSSHLCEARKALSQNYTHNHKCNWINLELSEGFEIKILEIDSCDETVNWEDLEMYWIQYYKDAGFSLVNTTIGGEGCPGVKQSKEWITKRMEKQIGVSRSEECKQNISKALTGRVLTEEHKNNVRDSIVLLQGRRIKQFDKEGNYIKTWDYIKQASKELGIDESNIGACCKYKPNHSTAGGYIWRYEEDDTPIEVDKSKYIIQLDLKGNYIKEWSVANQAAKELGLTSFNILKNCKGNSSHCGPYIFMFLEDYINITDEILLDKIKSIKSVARKVGQFDLQHNLISEFKNCKEAGKSLNLDRKKIAKCCKGEISSYNEFIFKYI